MTAILFYYFLFVGSAIAITLVMFKFVEMIINFIKVIINK